MTDGFKIFESDWTCRGTQYVVGQVHVYTQPLELGKQGLHYGLRPLDCINSYKPTGKLKYAKVRGSEQILIENGTVVTSHLEIIKELTYQEFIQLCVGQLKVMWTPDIVKSDHIYKMGQKCGNFTEYYNNGQIKTKGYYLNHQLNGLVTHFDKYGQVVSYNYYQNGRENHKIVRNRREQTICIVSSNLRETIYESDINNWKPSRHIYGGVY